MHDPEKSDSAVVAEKSPTKAGPPAAEVLEPRAGTKRNADQQSTHRTQTRARVTQALNRVRQAARQRKKERFIALLHHVNVDTLSAAYGAMSADQIGHGLKGKRNGTGWLVRCPCPNHGKGRGDRSPSLSVADGDDGRLLLRFFTGCEFADILEELRHRGLVDGSGSSDQPT